MMRAQRPNLVNAYQLVKTGKSIQTSVNGKMVPSRPVSGYKFRERLSLAYGVLTGRYDALVWPGQGDEYE